MDNQEDLVECQTWAGWVACPEEWAAWVECPEEWAAWEVCPEECQDKEENLNKEVPREALKLKKLIEYAITH